MYTIIAALALAATPTAQPAPAASVDHAKHAQHLQEMQKHHRECEDMMKKMHQGMGHDGHGTPQGGNAREHQEGSAHQ